MMTPYATEEQMIRSHRKDTMNKYQRLVHFMRYHRGISQLDGHKIGVTAVTQHCNRLLNTKELRERYMAKGEKISKRPRCEEGTRWMEYYITEKR